MNRPSKEGAKHLKSRFGILNACFSELETIGRDWRVLDDSLRYSLLAKLVEEVLEPYTEFYLTHSIVKFSKKHMDEYLRFPPNRVQTLIEGMFD